MERIIQMWHQTCTTSKSSEYFNYLQCFAIAGQRQYKSQMQPFFPPYKENKLTLKTNMWQSATT